MNVLQRYTFVRHRNKYMRRTYPRGKWSSACARRPQQRPKDAKENNNMMKVTMEEVDVCDSWKWPPTRLHDGGKVLPHRLRSYLLTSRWSHASESMALNKRKMERAPPEPWGGLEISSCGCYPHLRENWSFVSLCCNAHILLLGRESWITT
jgi:hypothetical protein